MSEYIVDMPPDCVDLDLGSYYPDERHDPMPILGEVVRCRDCAHYTDDEMEYYHYCGSWCEQVEPDGYCAWGEPRGEGE